MKLSAGTISEAVRRAREHSGVPRSVQAAQAGTSRAALDQIEKGQRVPRVDTFLRVLESAGASVSVDFHAASNLDGRLSLASFCRELDASDDAWMWRALISDFVANEFVPATVASRELMLADEPELFEVSTWNQFVAALAEHLAFHAEVTTPAWVARPGRGRADEFWWPVHGQLASMRSRALACSPASFKRRRILIDGGELPAVVR